MKYIYSIITFVLLTMFINAAGYGVVDFEYVANESKAQKSAAKQIKDYETSLRLGFEKEVDVIRKLEKDLTDNRSKFKEKELIAKENDYNKKVADFQKRAQEKQDALKNSAESASMAIEKALQEAVENVAKAKSLNIVYASAALAYYNKSSDISKDVLAELDKNLSKITVKKP